MGISRGQFTAGRLLGRDNARVAVEAIAPSRLPVPAARQLGGVETKRIDLRRLVALLVLTDSMAVTAAVVSVLLIRFGIAAPLIRFGIAAPLGQPGRYPLLAVVLIPLWPAAMGLAGAYRSRHLALGSELYARVVNGALWVLALAAFLSFALRADLSRALILAAIPLASVLTLAGRRGVRSVVRSRLRIGHAVHRVLAIGTQSEIRQLVAHAHRATFAGFRVVAAIAVNGTEPPELPKGVRVLGGDVEEAAGLAHTYGVDIIAVVAPQAMAPDQLRRLSWRLEGTAIDLALTPAITEMTGPRITMRPIAGLPLLWVEKPQLAGPKRWIKEAADRALSAVLLIGALPLLTLVAAAVKLTSSGPVLYRQQRVGLGGIRFRMLKFRSMHDGAADTSACEEAFVGPFLGKQASDARLTPIGAFLRRWSLDELPQLWNVLCGDMSLVGPRPLQQAEIDRCSPDVRRRLLVKPGITGLWQVSGRSTLSSDERMRLDLFYVDNWSVGLDLILLTRTIASVLRGRGAY